MYCIESIILNIINSILNYCRLFNHSVHQAIKTEDILNSKGAGQWKINWTLKPNREHFAAKLFDVIGMNTKDICFIIVS